MDNIINVQMNTKSNTRIITLIFATALALYVPVLNAYAAPQDPNFGFGWDCTNEVENLAVECCWSEIDEEGISLDYCQRCDVDLETGDISKESCSNVYPDSSNSQTIEENILSKGGKVIDNNIQPLQPQTQDRGTVTGQLQNQDLQKTPSFNQGNVAPTQGETLSNSNNLDNAIAQKESDDSSNSEGSADSNDNETGGDNPPQ